MKLSENKDVDSKFKFNPCAVPFIPSVVREGNNMVLSKLDVLTIDVGRMTYWNDTEPILDGLADLPQTDEDQSFRCLPSYMFSPIEKDVSFSQDLNGENQLNGDSEMLDQLETKVAMWLQDDDLFNKSNCESSICDGSWSATPASSASPPLNEDLDHNSVSYGSLPISSFHSDMAHSHMDLTFETSESTDGKPIHLPTTNLENLDVSDEVMRYYSPFGTGVSTWLAGEKNVRKESYRALEEIGGKVAQDLKEKIQKVGNIWNDDVLNETIAWKRQISVDDSDSLFLRSDSKDETILPLKLPWELLSALEIGSSMENARKKKNSLLKPGLVGSGGEGKCFLPKSEDTYIPTSLDNGWRGFLNAEKDRLRAMNQNHFHQNYHGEQNSNNHPRPLPNAFYPDPAYQMLPEAMTLLPHFAPGFINPTTGAVPVIYIPAAPSTVRGGHPRRNQHYNNVLPHQIPAIPSFVNLDYQSSIPQFYQNFDQMAFIGHGNRGTPFHQMNRQSGPALELHQRLDVCYDQFKHLENERKKTEAALARQHPGKEVTSDNTLSVPLMPPNPSRIDRLVVEVLREHARVVTLVSRMEQLRGVRLRRSLLALFEDWLEGAQKLQTCRKNEIINRKKYRLDSRAVVQKDKDVLDLANALADLAISTRKARTALWCALQLSSKDLPPQCIKQATRIGARDSLHDSVSTVQTQIPWDQDYEGGRGPPEGNNGFFGHGYDEDAESNPGDYPNEMDPEASCEEYPDDVFYDEILSQQMGGRDSDYDVQQMGGRESVYDNYPEVGGDVVPVRREAFCNAAENRPNASED